MTKRTKVIVISIASLVAIAVTTFLLVWFLYVIPERAREENAAKIQAYRDQKFEKYASENTALGKDGADVIFLGDSLTDGCDIARYYPEFQALNRGIGGDRTYDVLDRMQVSVYDAKPKVVVLLIGGNNVLSSYNLKQTATEYEEILKGIQGNLPDTRVVVLSLTSMGGKCAVKNPEAAFLNYKIKDLAGEYGYTFVDVFTPLFDPEMMEIRAEYTADGAHLTDAGYRVLSATIKPAIVAALAR